MPGLYSDKTVWGKATRMSPATSGEVVVGQTQDGVIIFAGRFQYVGPAVANDIFQRHKTEPFPTADSTRQVLKVLGFEAIDDRRHQTGILVMDRRILVGHDLLLLVAVGPTSSRTEDIISTSFDSLRVQDPNPLLIADPPPEAFPATAESK
jgi:hypothetical protein